jgi:hypothetical protein
LVIFVGDRFLLYVWTLLLTRFVIIGWLSTRLDWSLSSRPGLFSKGFGGFGGFCT